MTRIVQIVPFIANAFSIFLFTQYFSTIPKSLDEAARIDGASWFTIYRRILVPLSGPAFATVAILTFLPAWNQYLWPLMVVQKEELRPVMVGMQYFFQLNTAWGEVMAYTSLITLPVLIVWGMKDSAFPPYQLERWRRLLPEAQVETIEGAGHWPHEEEPARVVAAIERFME